jgi:hypothetical protein
MKQSVLVVGHADADGHLIAEQTRRNLASIKTFDVSTVVDPNRTKDHRAWTALDAITEIDDADIVFFVDMMFAPSSFFDEAQALVDFVGDFPDKRFFLIDHHPLPLRRLEGAENLRVLYRPEVFDCVIGPRSGMMVIAALCEGQRKNVADITQPIHDTLALGMRRAAALGGDLPGEKLLALLKSDCWAGLLELGKDDRELHRLPRGRRPLNQPRSKALRLLEEAAEDLLARGIKRAPRVGSSKQGSSDMSYDVDVAQERFSHESGHRARIKNAPVPTNDLETIITLLEVAALSLTTKPGETFTRAELIREARRFAGDEIEIDDEDIKIVLTKQSFLRQAGAELCLS